MSEVKNNKTIYYCKDTFNVDDKKYTAVYRYTGEN